MVVLLVVVVVVPVVFNSVGNRRAAAMFAALVTPTDGVTDIRPFGLLDSTERNAAFAGATAHKTGKIPHIATRNFILLPFLVSIYYTT